MSTLESKKKINEDTRASMISEDARTVKMLACQRRKVSTLMHLKNSIYKKKHHKDKKYINLA